MSAKEIACLGPLIAARASRFGAAEAEGICAAMPARCSAGSGRAAPAPAPLCQRGRHLVRHRSAWCSCSRPSKMGAPSCATDAAEWDGNVLSPPAPSSPASAPAPPIRTTSPPPSSSSSKDEGVDMVTVVTEGIFSYCGVKVKIDTDRYLGPEQAAVRVPGRAGRPCDHRGIRLADAVDRRRAPSDRRLKKEGGVTCDTLLNCATGRRWTLTIDGGHEVVVAGRQGAGRGWRAGRAHARGLRFGHHRHLRQAVARPRGRSHRRRRSHHRRADRAPGRQIARHAPGRHPRARAQVDAGALFPGCASRASGWGGTDITDPLSIIEKIDPPWPGPACGCS